MSFRALFLPDGFPASVSSDYLDFQVYDSIQGLSSYCRGVLTTQALLLGLGVGEEAATPLNAAFQCAPRLCSVYPPCPFFRARFLPLADARTLAGIMKDLVGMLGGMLFSLVQGSSFDGDAKQWRFFADVMVPYLTRTLTLAAQPPYGPASRADTTNAFKCRLTEWVLPAQLTDQRGARVGARYRFRYTLSSECGAIAALQG